MPNRSRELPRETADRLVTYLRPLLCLQAEGTSTVSSTRIAELCSVNPAVVRKDFSFIGKLGTRGVGYEVDELLDAIRRELGLDRGVALIVVGVGNIGRALLQQRRFDFEGFRIVAAFDNDPEKIGATIGGTVVEDVRLLEERISEERIQLAVLTVPETEAPTMARRLGDAGVRSILSFAPCRIALPADLDVTCMDLSVLMAQIVCHSHRKEER